VTVPIFDLDGTLLDSDEALVVPFLNLGVGRERITFGEPVAEACARLGVDLDTYVDAYDPALARPFPGVPEMLARLDRWAVCSNKAGRSARADLARWGWEPSAALFTEDFGGLQKQLGPMLAALGLDATDVVFVGDSAHDRAAAAEVGCQFAVAGWNPRTQALDGDVRLERPADLELELRR
jgi:phosphoglycolate phosphatase-like HAD superfamily hydrolase